LTPRKIIHVLKLDCSARTVRRVLKSNKNAHYIKRKAIADMMAEHRKKEACLGEGTIDQLV
jgi:hypothetical protein